MQKDDSWLNECLEKIHESHPAITEAAMKRIKDLLSGEKGGCTLRGQELIIAAKALINDMADVSTTKAVEKHED
jgi:hypothetical protein